MDIKKVRKRHGHTQRFRSEKLENSLYHALVRSKKGTKRVARKLTKEVVRELGKGSSSTVSQEDIIEAVRKTLRRNRLPKVFDYYCLCWLNGQRIGIKAVRKRHGKKEDFHPYKIYKSIHKTVRSAKKPDKGLSETLTADVLKHLKKSHKGRIVPSTRIKETVEYVMMKHDEDKIAKAYIIHRYR